MDKAVALLATRAVALSEGVTEETAMRLGLIGWVMGLTPISILITKTVAAQQASQSERALTIPDKEERPQPQPQPA